MIPFKYTNLTYNIGLAEIADFEQANNSNFFVLP